MSLECSICEQDVRRGCDCVHPKKEPMTNQLDKDRAFEAEKINYAYHGKPLNWQQGFDKGFHEGYQAAKAIDAEKVAELEGTTLKRLMAEYDEAKEDAAWEPTHPIYQMAEHIDFLKAKVKELVGDAARLETLMNMSGEMYMESIQYQRTGSLREFIDLNKAEVEQALKAQNGK